MTRRIAAFFGMLLCSSLLASSAWAQCGDVNVDGVVNSLDPQVLRAYLADPVGSPLSPGGYAQCTVYGPPQPCGILSAAVLERSLTGLAPGLGDGCVDGDADGVPDTTDPCRLSPPGVPSIPGEAGCTVLDVIQRPQDLVDPALALLVEATVLLRGPDLVDTHALLRNLGELSDAWLLELNGSASMLPDDYPGAFCNGLWDDAASSLAQARALVNEESEVILGIVLGDDGLGLVLSDPPLSEELPDGHVGLLSLELGLARMDDAIAEIARVGDALGEACAANTGALAAEFFVEEIDDAARRVHVRDAAGGATFPVGLSSDANMTDISIGTAINLGGLGLGSGGALGDTLAPVDPGSSSGAQVGCLFLRVAPPQAFAPWSAEPLELDLIGGYQPAAGSIVLEHGARLAAIGSGCPSGNPLLGPFTRYSMEIAVEYPVGLPDNLQTRFVLAVDLDSRDTPVSLPQGLPNGVPAELIATVRKRTCSVSVFPFQVTCGPFTDERVDNHEITVVPTRSLCTANYLDTLTDLEDNDTNGFRNLRVTSLSVDSSVVEPGTSPVFEAQGCIAAPNATSCSNGQYVPVTGVGVFRIYNHDFHPVQAITHPAQSIFAQILHGVPVPAGVRWPRVRGLRNATEYHYSCQVPRVVRDVVDFCPIPPMTEDSYYRQPYFPGGPSGPGQWNMGRGNADQMPGHAGKQTFAFDIGSLEGAEIRAARGGRVALMREDGAINDKACWDQFWPTYNACVSFSTGGGTPAEQAKTDCMNLWITNFGRACDLGNYLYIRHQDGTYGNYFHMVQNSLPISPNQLVHRSDHVGDSGNTGASGGPHLHFHVQTTNGVDTSNSIKVRFQTWNQTCMIPINGDQSLSSNDPGSFY